MTHLLYWDVETRSEIDLRKVGAYRYASDPSTDVWVIGYAVDDGPTKVWHPGGPPPAPFVSVATSAFWLSVCHNHAFESCIMRHILGPRYGFPIIPLGRQRCTMAMANALALPGALEKVTKVLNVELHKDTIGSLLMLQMCKPRRPRKGEDLTKLHWFDDQARRDRLDQYCVADVVATRNLYEVLPPLSSQEQQVWQLDQHINDTGFYIDEKLALAARDIATKMKPRLNTELEEITAGEVTAYTQVDRIKTWLKPFCGDVLLDKDAIADLLDDDELPTPARRVIEIRQLGAQAAASKVEALLQRREADGRVRGAFLYHAAGPGRWSSKGAQVQNLKRPATEDVEGAIDIISQGDLDVALDHYANPLAIVGDLIRSMITAAPGQTLIGGDFSGIEARVTAWLAGEERKLDVFRAYDRREGPDPYIITASQIFNIPAEEIAAGYNAKPQDPKAREMRQVGKAAELAFGYQGGVAAYLKFDQGMPATERKMIMENFRKKDLSARDQTTINNIARYRDQWRRAHPNIVMFWDSINRAAQMAVQKPETIIHCGDKITLFCDDSPILWITLPSGRKLSYPHAHISRTFTPPGTKLVIECRKGQRLPAEYQHYEGNEKLIHTGVIFKDNTSGRWQDVRMYSGLLTENLVQAIARDLLAEAMLRIADADLDIVLHVHDSIYVEVAERSRDKPHSVPELEKKFARLMCELPPWAEGLPVTAKAHSGRRFA